MATTYRSPAQQQHAHGLQNLSDYQTSFNQRVIPIDLQGHKYPNAENIVYTDSTEHVATDFILIDSAFRSWDSEESNNYTNILSEELNYVHSLELVDGYVPSSGYLINNDNNIFYFQETKQQLLNKTYYTVSIPIGNYDINALLNQIKAGMQQASKSKSIYKITVDLITDRVTISTDDAICTGIFNLIFTVGSEVIGDRGYMDTMVIDPVTQRKEIKRVETSNSRNQYISRSIGKMIGFKAINLAGQSSYTGQMVYKLRPYEYLNIFVNTVNADDFKKIITASANEGAEGAFAICHLDRSNEYFDIFGSRNQVIDNARLIRTFNPPISFSKLRIQFKTNNNTLYDFNGLDNYLLFEVKRVFNRKIIDKLGDLK